MGQIFCIGVGDMLSLHLGKTWEAGNAGEMRLLERALASGGQRLHLDRQDHLSFSFLAHLARALAAGLPDTARKSRETPTGN